MYTQEQLNAAVSAERERCAAILDERVADCEAEHASDGDERWLVYAKHARRMADLIRNPA